MIVNPHVFDSGPPPTTYFSVVMADLPISLCQLADASGATAVDVSGNHNDLTYTVTTNTYQQPTLVTTGDFCCALADRIVCSTSLFSQPNTHGWAEELWCEVSSNALQALCALGDSPEYNVSSSYGSVVYMNAAGKLVGWIYNGSVTQINGTTIVSTGSRHHVVFEVDLDADEIRLWLDGNLEGSASLGGNPPQSFTTYWHVGYCAASSPNGVALNNFGVFQGSMQYVALYLAPLGATRVAAHWNEGK